MKTREAIERVKSRFDKWALDEKDLEALRALGLVAESNDERIRQEIVSYLNQFSEEGLRGVDINPWIAYLEKQKEWSEEDEYCRNQLIVFCENCMQQDSAAIRCANWLKSLRPQNNKVDKFKPEEGDIVVNKDGVIAIFESWGHHPDGGSFNDKSYFFAKCTLDNGYYNEIDCHPDSNGLRHATQEEIRKLIPYLLKEQR